MKIAIISDTHDNLANLKKATSFIGKNYSPPTTSSYSPKGERAPKIKVLIHCGDVFGPEIIKEILKNFSGKAHFVLSDVDEKYFENIEENYFQNFPRIKIWKKLGEIEIDKKKIAFCHSPRIAMGLALSQKYDIVFYGHLHKPWEMKIKRTKLVNPGNLAGIFFKPTFAVYDTKTDKLELKIL